MIKSESADLEVTWTMDFQMSYQIKLDIETHIIGLWFFILDSPMKMYTY